MAQRISEQVIEYLTVGGDGFTPQTNVPLTINGTLAMNDNNVSYPGRETWTWPTTWLLTPTNNNFTIAKNNDDQGVFSSTKPSFAINNDEIKIGKKLLISTGSSNGGFYLSYETNSTSIEYGSFYIPTRGTTSTQGIARLEIGNNKQSSTDEDNAQGILRLYSRKQGYSEIYAALDQTTTEKKHYLPDSTGWLVTGGNGFNSGVGSSTEPVFVQTTGVATKCSKYAGGTEVTLNNSNQGAKTASFYAPTTGGTSGYILKANGNTSTPSWLQTLPTANGGTGNTSFTQYRLIYTSTATKLSTATNLYTNGSNLAINKTSITNGFSFEVNGNSKFTGSLIPSSDSVFDLGDENTYWWNNVYANYFSGLSEATNKLITYVGRDVSIPTTANYGGAGAVFHIIGKSGENGNGSPIDMNILQMNWDNDGGYDSQLGIANGTTPQFLFRSQISNNNTNWRQAASIAQGTKTGSVTKPVYVDSSGEIKTINVTISSGTQNGFTYYSSNNTLSSTNAIQYNATYGVIMEKAKIKALIPYYLCTDCLNTDTWFFNPSWHVLFNMTASNKPTEAGLYLTTLSVKYQKALILGGNFSYTNCNVYWGGVLPITPAEGSLYDNLFYQLTNSIDSQGSNNVQLGYYFGYYDNSTHYGTVFNINFTDADGDCQYKILEAKLTLQKITSLLI